MSSRLPEPRKLYVARFIMNDLSKWNARFIMNDEIQCHEMPLKYSKNEPVSITLELLSNLSEILLKPKTV